MAFENPTWGTQQIRGELLKLGIAVWPEFGVLFAEAIIGIACVTPYTFELTREAIKKAENQSP
jgi:hypothetical protein